MGLTPVTDMWRELRRRCALFYYEAALRQIWPLHPDVPEIVWKLHELRRIR